MADSEQDLERHLLATQALTPEQISAARRHAEKEHMRLDQALASMRLMDYTELGWSLSRLLDLPYRRLMSHRPPESVCSALSPRAAASFGAFPVAYDSRHNILTLAVDTTDTMLRMERVRLLLMQGYDLAFTAASRAEIEKAFEFHYGILLAAATRRQTLPGLHAPPPPATVPAPSAPPARPSAEAIREAPTAAEGATTDDITTSLNAVAALAASLHLKEDPARLEGLRNRVRYCRLLAARLGLSAGRTEALTLAAWLSAIEDREDLLRNLPATFNTAGILFPGAVFPDAHCVESRILSLVRRYEDFAQHDPSSARDVGATRRHLRAGWANTADDEKTLEYFLQVLIDEEFLAELEQKAARILVVDADAAAGQAIAAPLRREGYDVVSVQTASAAMAAMARMPIDVVMANLDLPREDTLAFCQRVKRSAQTAHIAFVIVTGPDGQQRAAEGLRAGADDFLTQPINPEVLSVKVQRIAAAPAHRKPREGVTGSLTDMSFADMIQILSAGGKSMEIAVVQGNMEGRVFLLNGDVIHACVDELSGEEAFYRMMSWKTGGFSTRQCLEFPERSIHAPVMSLLMEGARLVDESDELLTAQP